MENKLLTLNLSVCNNTSISMEEDTIIAKLAVVDGKWCDHHTFIHSYKVM